MNYQVELRVRPKAGVRDPQGEAVQEALHGVGFDGVHVHYVGRTLRFDVPAASEEEARSLATQMCERLLVNPHLETFDLHLSKG